MYVDTAVTTVYRLLLLSAANAACFPAVRLSTTEYRCPLLPKLPLCENTEEACQLRFRRMARRLCTVPSHDSSTALLFSRRPRVSLARRFHTPRVTAGTSHTVERSTGHVVVSPGSPERRRPPPKGWKPEGGRPAREERQGIYVLLLLSIPPF